MLSRRAPRMTNFHAATGIGEVMELGDRLLHKGLGADTTFTLTPTKPTERVLVIVLRVSTDVAMAHVPSSMYIRVFH